MTRMFTTDWIFTPNSDDISAFMWRTHCNKENVDSETIGDLIVRREKTCSIWCPVKKKHFKRLVEVHSDNINLNTRLEIIVKECTRVTKDISDDKDISDEVSRSRENKESRASNDCKYIKIPDEYDISGDIDLDELSYDTEEFEILNSNLDPYIEKEWGKEKCKNYKYYYKKQKTHFI